jgi:hypothetical protein
VQHIEDVGQIITALREARYKHLNRKGFRSLMYETLGNRAMVRGNSVGERGGSSGQGFSAGRASLGFSGRTSVMYETIGNKAMVSTGGQRGGRGGAPCGFFQVTETSFVTSTCDVSWRPGESKQVQCQQGPPVTGHKLIAGQ